MKSLNIKYIQIDKGYRVSMMVMSMMMTVILSLFCQLMIISMKAKVFMITKIKCYTIWEIILHKEKD